MNEATSTPGTSLIPETTDLFTAGHLALIALLAVLAIVGLVWGMRNARARRAATRDVVAHNEAVMEEHDACAAESAPPTPRPSSTAPTELLFDPLPDVKERFAPRAEPATRAVEIAPAVAATPPVAEEAPEPAIETNGLPPADLVAAASSGPSPAHGPVTQLKGLGPKLAAKLAEHGITTVGQLAALSDDEAAALDARLGPFTGRMNRDRWLEQARFLAAGDRTGFEAVFGRL